MDSHSPTRLPRLMVVSDRRRMEPSFEGALETVLRAGARLVQLREKYLSRDQLRDLGRRAAEVCREDQTRLLLNGDVDLVVELGLWGVHLPEANLADDTVRAAVDAGLLCGVSVHSVEAARRAREQGAGYVVFGPVYATATHPETPPAGLLRLREVASAAGVPVLAIGGITAENAAECRAAGAHGVAVLGAIWEATDVAAAVAQLLRAVEASNEGRRTG